MNNLKQLIKESRDWATADRGSTLFSKVSNVLKNTFGLDAGMFIYRRQFVLQNADAKDKVYEPWGLDHSAAELTKMLNKSWITGKSYVIPDRWLSVNEISPVWQKLWTEQGIRYIGAWKLIIQSKCVGAIVVGRKTVPDETNDELMSLLATHVSLIGEMLVLRRIAEHESRHDELTQIYNRRGFISEIRKLSRRIDENFIIGILDINDFKGINDAYGHATGDSVLIEVAETLIQNIGSKGLYGRGGGDEFMFVLQSGQIEADHAASYATDWFKNKRFTVSVGCELWQPNKTDWEVSLQIADHRLYTRKQRER
ncbi:GGDEF domain-containing protein [Alicyclobacillus sp. SO9]|uniref:GGDEF domain-containing protein n=1 Tax=Alicyclobacillus sp. SO9 TaxID=2665646 RepID=UPI0018E7786D|nr:GGDEF domain-containing protein [Alicyclobacillus sp. SO9]QQE80402.1 GGDEF domain-containing protein [Alicyclobacillus sp. SO9]